jgi:hypothetical protein
MSRFSLLLSFLVTLLAGPDIRVSGCDLADCLCKSISQSRQSGCWVATTASFRVYSFSSSSQADQVAKHCEHLRAALAQAHGLKPATNWNPKCEVFLFVNKHKYGAVVGRQAMETLGSSLVTPETGSVTSRRIDLRTDVPNYLEEVLPHELTHVLIADQFRDCPPPLWYDEGLALLADSQSKQVLHQRDLRIGVNRGATFSLTALLTTKSYPSADRVGVFYGQCASVTRYLCQAGPPEKVHDFARRSEQVGVNLALKEAYGINGVAELEPLWRKSLSSQVTLVPAHYSHIKKSD